MELHFTKLASARNAAQVNTYLEDKPKLNLVPMKDKFQATLLHHCSFNNQLDKMKALVRHMKQYFYKTNQTGTGENSPANQYKLFMKAWVNQPNNQGYIPSHYACLYGNVEMLHFLIELGCNIYYKSHAGQTLLHMCAQNNQLAPMLYLWEKDLNFNEVNREKQTPLHQASLKGYADIVSFLAVLPQIQLNAENHEGDTPLMLAVKEGKVDVVKRLLVKGANRTLKNYQDQTAMDIARAASNTKVQAILNDEYTCLQKTLILCNKKTVYRPQQPSSLLVWLFTFLFLTSVLSSHILYKIDFGYLIIAAVFFAMMFLLFFSLLRKPKISLKQPFNTLAPPICAECQIPFQQKTYHCFICQQCVYRYDHHCPWINNCVGAHNFGRFALFLFMLIIGILELGFVNVYFGILQPTYQFDFPYVKEICLGVTVYNFLVCLFIGPVLKLLISQLKSMLLNKTGYQRHRMPAKRASVAQKQSLLADSQTVTESQYGNQGYSLRNCFLICQQPPELIQ